MYLDFFELREDPFGVTPDPRFLYLGPMHREALASLVHGIRSGRGFFALIADPGMGKTTLLYRLLQQFRGAAETVMVFNTQCTSRELMALILADMGLNPRTNDLAVMQNEFHQALIQIHRSGRQFLLLIDEAQNLSASVLETIRLLSDFETPSSKLMQIVLSGQPQLANKLNEGRLAQLRQRISIHCQIPRLGPAEVQRYIEHRLAVVQAPPDLFLPEAVRAIVELSRGIPRSINNYCFNALSLAAAVGRRQVDAEIMAEVAKDLTIEPWEAGSGPVSAADEHQIGHADPFAQTWARQATAQVHVNNGERAEVAPSPRVPEYRPPERPVEAKLPVPAATEAVPAAAVNDALPPAAAAVGDDVRKAFAAQPRTHAGKPRRRAGRGGRTLLSVSLPLLLLLGLGSWAWSGKYVGIAGALQGSVSERLRGEQPAAEANEATSEEQVTPQPASNSVAPTRRRTAAPTRQSARQVHSPAVSQSLPNETSAPEQQEITAEAIDRSSEPSSSFSDPLQRPGMLAQSEESDRVTPPGIEIAAANTPQLGQLMGSSVVAAPPAANAPATPPIVEKGRLIRQVAPRYPSQARSAGVEGAVVLKALIQPDGKLRVVDVVRGHPLLVQAATEAVRQWRYEPYRLRGVPIEAEAEVTINFKR